jgi:hypothetical protein
MVALRYGGSSVRPLIVTLDRGSAGYLSPPVPAGKSLSVGETSLATTWILARILRCVAAFEPRKDYCGGVAESL